MELWFEARGGLVLVPPRNNPSPKAVEQSFSTQSMMHEISWMPDDLKNSNMWRLASQLVSEDSECTVNDWIMSMCQASGNHLIVEVRKFGS